MTRFMMTLEESVRLVLRSLVLSVGGEVYVTKMPVFNIGVLGEAMKRVYGPKSGRDPASIKTEVTSLRPGEKLYEELTTGEEVARSVEVEDFICVKPPASKSVYASLDYSNLDEVGTPLDRVYSSETEPHLGEEECIELFRRGGLL